MDGRAESQDLKDIRKLLVRERTPPENVVEYYGTEDGIEALKEKIREGTQGCCYFFHRAEKDEIHLIAFVNIKNVAELFEKIKELKNLNKINYSTSQKSSFNPKGISFGK